jgi:hypothetical protein
MKKTYGDMETRAKRYVVSVAHYGEGFEVAREKTKLPRILASAINKVIFDPERKLRVEISKLQKYLDFCMWNYREYYKSRNTKQLAAS